MAIQSIQKPIQKDLELREGKWRLMAANLKLHVAITYTTKKAIELSLALTLLKSMSADGKSSGIKLHLIAVELNTKKP